MNRYLLMVAAIAAIAAVSCTSVEQQSQQSSQPREEKTYNTGSRIPVYGGGSAPVRSVEPTKETQEDINARSRVVVPGKGGGPN